MKTYRVKLGHVPVVVMRQHVIDLLKADPDLVVNWIPRRLAAGAAVDINEIWIAPIRSKLSYAIALHELGHLRGAHRHSRYLMTRERDAWRWANHHALLWDASMHS
jgi:hypothetical protein